MKRVETDDKSTKYEPLIDELKLKGIVSTAWLNEPADLFLPPPIFSRFDQVTAYNFQSKTKEANDNSDAVSQAVIGYGVFILTA